ncbi:MAG: hypothetical protein JST28_06285 [Acidobacteria bacterium]|nr:hypothetical protein [Acidobacteriota bacterium]
MQKLSQVFDGWDGYQTSLMRAVTPLTPDQLAFKAGGKMRSIGQLIRHIALGRITWLSRIEPVDAEQATCTSAAVVHRWRWRSSRRRGGCAQR